MKEISSYDDMQILYELIFSEEHKKTLDKTHLAKDKNLLRAIWQREYKNKYLKEELVKGRRYKDIKDDLEADLKPPGFEETKDEPDRYPDQPPLETDSDTDIYA